MNATTPAVSALGSLLSDTRNLASKLFEQFNSQDTDQQLKCLLNDVTPSLHALALILEHRAQQQQVQ